MIEVKNLVKRYGDHVAVNNLSFTVEEGQIYGFLGPNGAGKSTTMNIITGYLASTEGEVLINGHNILEEPEEAKKCIGYLPELPPVYTDMTVLEYLKFVAELKKIPKDQRKKQILEVMNLVKITDMQNRLIKNLSKGYRQRVGLAQAVLGYPPIIILDEPTVGLDPKQIIEIRDLIKSLGKKHTVILSSHILSEVSAVCDYVMIIAKGQLVASDTPENLSKLMLGSNTVTCTVHGTRKQLVPALSALDAKEIQYENTPNPILFIDEIHRFSKAQQDSLLAAVEKGTVTLIGATTENPSFEVISPLLSRCQVYVLKSQEKKDLEDLIDRAVAKDYYLSKRNITVKEKEAMISYSGGDARKLLNILELVVNGLGEGDIVIDNEAVHRELHENPLMYDKDGEQHYDIVSAMIKSIRGGDPNAAVYWMARMLQGGEDPKFIARRLIISAAEDIGLANPNAILIANTCFEVVHKIGMPEARIPLSECVIYLATSPKSNSAYLAIDAAIATVKQTGNSPVPLHLRNAPTKLMKDLNYGQDYKYPHDYPGNFVEQPYLPEELKDKKFYQPQQNAQEVKILERLKAWWRKYR